jgi:hypothetical protein
MIVLQEIELPPYLRWDDEFTWSPVVQSEEYSTSGALLLDVSVKQAGRPMTLVGTEHLGWISRAKLLLLQALADTHEEMEIDYHGRVFTVRFRYTGPPVTAEKIIPRIPEKETDPYRNLRINLIIVG